MLYNLVKFVVSGIKKDYRYNFDGLIFYRQFIFKSVFIFSFITSLCFSMDNKMNENHYRVHFFLLPSLDMVMKQYYPQEYKGELYECLDFENKTRGIFDKIFKIDNTYKTLYDPLDYSCKFQHKIIDQPNVKQNITSEYFYNEVQYSNGKTVSIPMKMHNFFSMLMHLRKLNIDKIEKKTIPVEIEGIIFNTVFQNLGTEKISVGKSKIETNKIIIQLIPIYKNQESVLDITDVFFWKISDPKGEKIVWIECGEKKRIIKAKFSESATWLEVKLVEEGS